MKPVNILFDEDLRVRADAFCATRKWSFGKLVRLALIAYLNRYAR
jgi:hypothetical protein